MVSKSRVDAYMWLGLTAFEQGPRQQFELVGFQFFCTPTKIFSSNTKIAKITDYFYRLSSKIIFLKIPKEPDLVFLGNFPGLSKKSKGS